MTQRSRRFQALVISIASGNAFWLFLDDGNIEATNNRRERELRRLVLGRKNWLFTWLDAGAERTANILTIIATAIAHEIDPRAYPIVTKLIVRGWPRTHIRDLLPDRILAAHPIPSSTSGSRPCCRPPSSRRRSRPDLRRRPAAAPWSRSSPPRR